MSALVRPAPTRRSWPLVGATFSYIHDPLQMMRRQYDACGPVSEIDLRRREGDGPARTGRLRSRPCATPTRRFANGLGWGEIVGPSSTGD